MSKTMATNSAQSSAFTAMAAALAVSLVGAAGILYLQAGAAGDGGSNNSRFVAVSQSLPRHAMAAVNGADGAFTDLAADIDRLSGLQAAGTLPGDAASWSGLAEQAGTILGRQSSVDAVWAAERLVTEQMPGLLEGSDALLGQSGSTAAIQAFRRRAVAMQAALAGLVMAEGDATVAEAIAGDMAYLQTVAAALAGEATDLDIAALGDAARESLLLPVTSALNEIEGPVAAAVQAAPALDGLGDSLSDLSAAAQTLLATIPVSAGAAPAMDGPLANPWLPIGLLGLALVLLVGVVYLHSRTAVFERASREQAEQNERNQQAILRLLDELGSLADGDLTVEATVTEDITGAIADSINYAIEKLRELVATINETAIMVDSAAKSTASTATHMARAADTQAREITAATESIVSMASSIEEVSGNAERSSDVARHSVEVAHKGGEAVRRTIDGMNTIRETIQETSKRIKRLGESSQEIGNIIELINDIAEQTNILALNASIQASMAGEAGRGFAVVADEVQRLAERSTNATKQIEVLVRTIQSDTNEAVVSMERSTTDVVGGALLAENAGAALDEIEQVSNQIANLVQNISSSARQQAGSAADVTRRTTKLKEISDQTGKATTATAASIAKLSELASQLRQTVAGFTLPSAALQASALSQPQAAEPPPAAALQQVAPEKAAG
jgi:twitching motility protein PilJ